MLKISVRVCEIRRTLRALLQHNYACAYISRRFKPCVWYFSGNETISSAAATGQINGKERRQKTFVVRIGHLAARSGSLHSAGIRDTKDFSPPPPPRDCKRTRKGRNAPLTSDAPNAIRTTLTRNISQIGVECLATSNFRPFRASKAVLFAAARRVSHSLLLRARISK